LSITIPGAIIEHCPLFLPIFLFNLLIIELVSSIYGVNKTWLKTGSGKMFEGTKLDKQLHEMNILFNQLNPHFKGYFLSRIKQLIKLQNVKDT
jgi:hypothetical protein